MVLLGLGNPGRRFAATRHNVGFWVLDLLAARSGTRWRRPWPGRRYRFARPPGGRYTLVRPTTYMNRSGVALAAYGRRHTLTPADVLVLVDNIDLPPGQIRCKTRGGAPTHNGLRSVSAALAGDDYARLYIGVGRPQAGVSIVDHVLGAFDEPEREAVVAAVERAAQTIATRSWSTIEQLAAKLNERRRR